MTTAMVRIHRADGRYEDRAFPVGKYLVGRDAGDIVLGDPNTSGRHAELYVEPNRVGILDIGSTNGTFDTTGRRLSGYHVLQPGEWVRLGNCAITFLSMSAAQPARYAPAQGYPAQQPGYAQAQAQAYAPPPAAAAALVAVGAAAAPGAAGQASGWTSAGGESSGYSHPDQAVRHTYPVTQRAFGVSGAAHLLMKTSPFLVARLATLVAVSTVGLVYWLVAIAGFVFLGRHAVVVGWAWLIFACVVAGWFWRVVVRYFLYLLKMGHIAVLTELIAKGQIGNGSEGMFSYGKRIVIDRFGQIAALFAVDALIGGVVAAFNRTLDWVSHLIPIPGLQSLVGFVKAVLRACTRYIAETIFSYNLARGDSNVFRSSKDGLIYYAQNSKEILKTGIWVVVLESVLSILAFVVFFVPSLVFVSLLGGVLHGEWGGWLQFTAIVAAYLYAGNVRDAILRPLFLTMILLKFHETVQGQAINLEWDQRLTSMSDKFRQLTERAAQWVAAPAHAPAP